MKRSLMILTAVLFAFTTPCLGQNLNHYSEPMNFHFYAQRLIQYHDNGSYDNAIEVVADQAKSYLVKRVKQNAERSTSVHHEKLAVMIDIDETALSNFSAIRVWLQGVNNVGDTLPPFIIEKLQNFWHDPAILPILNLYRLAVRDHVTVFFVTGRTDNDRQKTKMNLDNVGYTQYEQLILRSKSQGSMTAKEYKNNEAKAIVDEGYDIVLAIGDQYSDLPKVADRKYKLPNPFYYIA